MRMSRESARQERIRDLEEQLRSRGTSFVTGDDFDEEMRESFLQHVLELELAEHKPLRQWLAESGYVPVIDPQDDRLSTELVRLLDQLAFIGVFVEHTDHLSDRQLYAFLTGREHLDTPTPVVAGTAMHIDILGGCSDEDNMLFLKYYATEEDRARWKSEFPDEELPAREWPPLDRDRHLPKADQSMRDAC